MPSFYTPPPDLSNYPTKAEVPPQNFVTSLILTTADMHATYPAGAAYRGKYCRVSDMWGSTDGVYRCCYNGRIHFWEPTNQNQMPGNYTVTGSVTVQPMSSAPIMELLGNLPALTTWTITLGTDNLPPGIIKEFRPSLSSLLGTLNVAGLGIGSVVSLALGGNRRFVSMDNGSAVIWRQLN